MSTEDTTHDVVATSGRTYEASNYVPAWFPQRHRITTADLDDTAFLELQYPGIKFAHASGLDMPVEDLSFDVVHSSAVLEHVGSFIDQMLTGKRKVR